MATLSLSEFVVEFEELRLGPGTWHVLRSVRGGQSHTVLPLEPFATYRFRVIAINDLGKSEPSAPSDSITTPPAVPDTNPSNVRGNGTAEDNMVIDWEELAPLQHNAPGFQYKVMWREAGHGSDWHVNYTAMPPFKVMGTPTFTQYDIAVQAVNTVGLGPPPNITSGYSGEGHFSITHAARRKRQSQRHKLHGERERGRERRGEAEPEDQDRGGKKGEREEHVYTVPGSQTEKQVDDLRPFSRYRLEITAFNSRGEGPASEGDTFKTPESVPGKPQALRFESPSETVLVVHWAPPRQINGVLRGYRLQYQKIVDSGTSVGADLKLNASVSHYTVAGLDSHGRYRFTLAAMTTVGEGPAIMQDVDTILDGVPPYNISMSEGETLVNVSWEQGRRYRNLPFHICYKNKNVQERCTERLNTTQGFYQLGGLQPGSTYTLSFNYMNSTDFWKTVVQTKGPGLAEVHGGFATQGWFIGLISAIVLLLLVLLILCFIKRSKGGKYSVKDKEEAHVDSEARPMKDETFGEYSDNEEKRSCVSQRSLSGEVKALGSVDSLAEYGDSVDAQFNEDGSFIGQYSGKRESAGVAGGSSGNASPINPVPPFAPGPLD
ncbi:L1CAM protein, partial [Amia calva]|nr:L1CAM protein [Amia calva]